MINFLNLEYFLAAAEELNITRAAKRLYISQQSLSNHISNLEKEFDVQLFNRTTPLTPTYAGRALKLRAKPLLELRYPSGFLTRGDVFSFPPSCRSTAKSFRTSSFTW